MKTLLLELANNYSYLFLIFSFFVNSLFWFYKIIFSKNWIIENIKVSKNVNYNDTFYILIPVLDEEKIIKETAKYFLNLLKKYENSKLIFITTSKETENTIVLAKQLSKEYDKILHFHYSGNGVMAHQLNYAISEIKKFDKKNNFIAVYNADSRPHKNTFDYVFSRKDLEKKNAFQQYGDYTLNYNSFPKNFFKNSILTSSAGWQNRWSLGIEIFRAVKNIKRNGIFKPLSYCIGHGMFLRLELLKKVGGFSEKTHNEDLVMGYVLNNLDEKIYPIPFFDYSESPNLISSLFFQKANWFFGPGQFYDYYKFVKNKKLYKNKILLISYTLKVLELAIVWILGPTLLFILLLFSLKNIQLFLIFLAVYILSLVLPNYLSLIYISKLEDKKIDNNIILFVKVFIGSIFAYLMHGISGWLGLYRYIKKIIWNSKIEKGKTKIKR